MKTPQRRNYLQLMLLALVFACPGLAAWQFYKHPQWLGSAAINRGQLLSPPERLAFPNSKAKWRLVLWSPAGCDQLCLQQLDKLARIRLALGRRLYEVDEWLIHAGTTTDDRNNALPDALISTLRDQDIHIQSLTQAEQSRYKALGDTAQIFIANPDNYLVLSYQTTTKPEDIFHDIKHLLRSNEK